MTTENFSITLTPKDLDYVVNAIAQRPYIECVRLIADIQRQITAQRELPAAEPPTLTDVVTTPAASTAKASRPN